MLPCRAGGFHGRTTGALALTSSKYIYGAGFGPFMPGIHRVPFPCVSPAHQSPALELLGCLCFLLRGVLLLGCFAAVAVLPRYCMCVRTIGLYRYCLRCPGSCGDVSSESFKCCNDPITQLNYLMKQVCGVSSGRG